MPVATTFEFRDESGNSLSDVALAEGGHLDKMVTVVDAANLTKNYSSAEFLKDQGESLGEEDERTLVEQIEFANVIVLNKVDLVSQEELKAARAIIRSLNAKAKLIEKTHAE